ncbi:MAG: ribonuclease HI [Bacteroidales bacterium]|nr:ribonuclease HI [Bacteroidales bacterium]
MDQDRTIFIYSDGSSRGNPGPGGYGVILQYGPHIKEISAGYALTTNNRMELLGVITGLEALKKPGCNVRIVSDSKYVVDAVNKGWLFAWEKKNFVKQKNSDLWKRFLEVYRKHNVTFTWIKGHNNHPQNERCDSMAVAAALDSTSLLEDSWYVENALEIYE